MTTRLQIGVFHALMWTVTLLLAISISSVAQDAILAAESVRWPSVTGKLLRVADPDQRPASGYFREREVVEYAYRVNGTSYTSQRVNYTHRYKWSPADVRELLEAIPNRPAVTVRYQPDAPGISVLQPGGDNTGNLIRLGLQFALVGLVAHVWRRQIRDFRTARSEPKAR